MLEQLQTGFLAAIRGAACNVDLGPSAVSTAQALQIYRRNYAQSHIAALADTYSSVSAIVGERYFRHLAGMYVNASDSNDGDLNAYGAAFPAFLRDAPGVAELPYLADIARLDWAWLQMLRAPYRIDDWLPQLLSLDPARWPGVRAVSGCVRIGSDYPLHAIWALATLGGAQVDLTLGAQTVLLTRPNNVEVNLLDPAEDGFLACWLGGGTLDTALECALGLDPSLDVGRLLTRMATIGAIESIESTL